MESFHGDASEGLDYIAEVQQQGFIELRATLSEGLSKIASAIEWGFREVSWQLQQQTNVLRGIDQTLKTPGETQANEWRRMAEELRHRGVMDESEEFYLKALALNRLDYRIYVGLAETYLRSNKFDKARMMLEKSLPHAPKKEIDYKSYSYRLIGHISACEEDYRQATSMLGLAIELSPDYADGHYDRAQYCAQLRNVAPCLSSLEKAILARSLYYYLAEKEQNFDPIRAEVEKLLSRIRTEASSKAKDTIAKAERVLGEAREEISEAKQALIAAWSKATLNSISVYENAEAKVKVAKDKVASGDYSAFLEAQTIAEEAYSLAKNAVSTAGEEREYYKRRRKEKIKRAIPYFIVYPPSGGFWGVIIGLILNAVTEGIDKKILPFIGCLVGIVVGIIGAVKAMKSEDSKWA